MTAEEIRATEVPGTEGKTIGTLDQRIEIMHANTNLFLREIAAQLADLNKHLMERNISVDLTCVDLAGRLRIIQLDS